ncbi:MAG TPA: hypothetical protein VFY35_11000, partial [Burkholderiaceae bacterium]|nr:hypothetical protein [Burkholderiaceae bacterium]
MTDIRNTLIGLCMAATSLGAWAQTADEHKEHHPADANAPAKSINMPVKAATTQPLSTDQMARMDQHMKSMQAMHDKMMAAKTTEERQALMAEHMKLMQEGMSMMKNMGDKGAMGGMQGGQ